MLRSVLDLRVAAENVMYVEGQVLPPARVDAVAHASTTAPKARRDGMLLAVTCS